MEIYTTLLNTNTIILLVVIVIKTILFYSKRPYHKLSSWILFNRYQLANSHSDQSLKSKKFQNFLSIITLLLCILELTFLILTHVG